MLVALAFVPSAPLLLSDLGGGPADLRSACLKAISALASLEDVVVIADAPVGFIHGTVDATPYGAPGTASLDALPLPLAVGASLLGERPHRLHGVAGEAVRAEGLVVVGDGTARRSLKAPGHLDDRAAGFDALVARALAAGDPELLAALDPALAQELMVGGLAAWRSAAASASGASWSADVLYDDAPFGVGYVVATWTRLGS